MRGVYIFLGIIFIASGTGTYQANYPVSVTALLLSLFVYILNENSKKQLFGRTLLYIATLFASLIVYLAFTYIFAHLHNENFSSYAGIDSIGKSGISVYLSRIKIAFVNFGQIDKENRSYNMFPMTTNIIFKGMLVMLLVMSIFLCANAIKQKKYINTVMIVLLLALFPLSVNLIFVLSNVSAIHTLAMYAWIFVPVFLILQTQFIARLYAHIFRQLTIISGAVVIMLALMYSRYSNVCYLEATLIQSQTISYFDQMITRIRSVSGYTNETPIVFINERELHDSGRIEYSEFEAVSTIPYKNSIDAYLNTYGWATFMANWNGYSPIRGNPSDYDNNIEVIRMPEYPDDGSIMMIDDAIIVKFGR